MITIIPKKIIKKVSHLKKTCNDIEGSYSRIINDFLCNECSNNNQQTPLLVWKLQIYLQLVLHRTVDILDAVEYDWQNYHLSSISILLRAMYENVTVLYDATNQIVEKLQERDIDGVNEVLNTLIFRNNLDPHSPYRSEKIDEICDRIDEVLPGHRNGFGTLCEFAHPNFDGMIGLYGKPKFLKNRFWDILKTGKLKHEDPTCIRLSNTYGVRKGVIEQYLYLLSGSLHLIILSYETLVGMYNDLKNLSDEEFEQRNQRNE